VNDVNSLKSFEARLTQLEKSGRRWRLACFAVMVVGVGMGAVAAVQDGEFGTVRAKKFELVTDNGISISTFHIKKMPNGDDSSVLIVGESTKKKAVLVTPGEQPAIVNN
jgi:hypothetical protein